jgi:hypothetical protein
MKKLKFFKFRKYGVFFEEDVHQIGYPKYNFVGIASCIFFQDLKVGGFLKKMSTKSAYTPEKPSMHRIKHLYNKVQKIGVFFEKNCGMLQISHLCMTSRIFIQYPKVCGFFEENFHQIGV